ncbi:class I adenylate-forming enzyme family protein [Mycobacterium stomatepiae]|uniref:AMP-dependent synthetase n=1 Tax=Mycobacterium stomatepiae TaxID=470076 RepID=A0A7I7Q742_9MYCO|nr:class I adenylate-forming enzyme family protein [Mycobacterium stomatepiae]MCV7163030.1 acyl--CoA ligase [Mycobacterium stomatepiae]BBY22175.1 AMP-dependent synthetase [Mycobacterium stomatepiae]
MATPIEAATIGQLLRTAADSFGDADAVVAGGTRLTFTELDQRTRTLARNLIGRGVTKGCHVGISFGNDTDFIVSLLAVSRIGAVAVPISAFARGRELLRLLRYGDVAAILTARTMMGTDQVERLAAALPGLESARGPFLTLPDVPNLRWVDFVNAEAGLPPWASSAQYGHPSTPVSEALLEAVEADVLGTDVALMIHTSGTTADPKGVPHLHDTVCFRARYLAERMQYRPGERTYTSHVLFWIGGLTMSLFTSLAAGATSVWCERFGAGEVLALIEREKVTRLVIYPHQVEQLLAHSAFATTDRASLRVADPRLVVGHEGDGIRTPEGHRMALGMSETFGPFSWGSGGANHIAAIEDIQPGLEVRVVDEHNQSVADGETGEIAVRGRCVTPGYYKRPKDFGFDADGWLHTGDRGLRDGNSIHYLGRLTQMIKTAGANVAPAEVAEAMLALNGVREAYVVPVPDDTRGQLVAAAAVLDSGSGLDAARIRAELKRDLSPYKVPTLVAIFESEEIPWTPTFKVRTHQLTDMILARVAQSAPR